MAGSQPTDSIENFKLTMNGQDVSGLVRTLVIKEGIKDPFKRCFIEFTDTRNIVAEAKAGQSVEVTIQPAQGQAIKGSFIIEKPEGIKVGSSGHSTTGQIRCVSEEIRNAASERITKPYKGMTSDKMASTIVKDHLKSKKAIKTDKGKMLPDTVLLNRNTPIEGIETARKHGGTGSQFQFFENDKGFNFRSYDEMLKGSPTHNFVVDKTGSTNIGKANNPNNLYEVNTSHGDVLGMDKKSEGQDTAWNPSGGQTKKLDKAPAYSSTGNRLSQGTPKATSSKPVYGTMEQYKADRGKTWAKEEQEDSKFTTAVDGLVTGDGSITVGNMVNVNMGSAGVGDSQSSTRSSDSGNWLVHEVYHVYNSGDEQNSSPYVRTKWKGVAKS